MGVYMIYLTWGPYLWVGQVLLVLVLGILGWRASGNAGSAKFQGSASAKLAAVLATVFVVLMAPVALMVALRTHDSMYPTSWTTIPGSACVAQAVLFLASWVNCLTLRRVGNKQ